MVVSIIWFLIYSAILCFACLRSYNLGYNDGYSQSTNDIETEVKEAMRKRGEIISED